MGRLGRAARTILSAAAALALLAGLAASEEGGDPADDVYWERPRLITQADSRFPSAVVAGERLLVFYESVDARAQTFTVMLTSRREGEIKWEKPRAVAGPFAYSGPVPDAFSAAESGGRVAVAVKTSTRTLGVYTSADGGGSFTGAEFDEQEKAVVGPRVFGTGSGGFMLFASLGEGSEAGGVGSFTMLSSSSADGSSWSPLAPFRPASTVSAPFAPHLSPAPGGDAVVFQGMRGGSSFQLFLTRSRDGGRTWTEAMELTSGGGWRNQRPTLADDGGRLLVAWERTESTSDRAQVMAAEIGEDGSLRDEYEVTRAGRGNAHRPQFFRWLGRTSLVWFDDRSGRNAVYMARRGGVMWQETALSAAGRTGEFAWPLITKGDAAFAWQETAADGTGRIAVLETDRSAEPPKISARSFRAGARTTSERAEAAAVFPDDPSGIAGWTWIWTQDAREEPPADESAMLPPSATGMVGEAPGDGRWYFRARVLDFAGNWSPASTQAFHRDLTPPSPPVIDDIAEDRHGFAETNSFSATWAADPADDDIAGWTWSLTPIAALPRELAVNRTHPLRLSDAQVERRVDSLIARATELRSLAAWGKVSRPPRRILGTEARADFTNEPNGLYVLSVAGIDGVGNIGQAADRLVLLNKYAPETKILAVTQRVDEMGAVELSITGEGFLYDGTISEVSVTADDGNSYTFRAEDGSFRVESDGRIAGIRIPDMRPGRYTVSIRHTDRGIQTWGGVLDVDESGAVVRANRYSFEPGWRLGDEAGGRPGWIPLPFALALALGSLAAAAGAAGLLAAARDAAVLRAEIRAAFNGGELPMAGRIELGRRGVSLKAKLFGFTTALVIGIVAGVAATLGTRLSRTQERTLLAGLQARVDVVMESMASGVRNYLPEAEEKTNEIMLLPTQTKFFSEANWATVTGLPADGSNANLDFVWSSNDPDIERKIDAAEFSQGTARLVGADERIFSLAPALNAEAAGQVREISAKMEAIRAEKAGASEERNAELNATLAELRAEIDSRLNELSADAAGSIPAFRKDRLDRSVRTYTFYKPVLFRMSGDNDTFVRAFLLMEVSTDTVREEIDSAIRGIIVLAAFVALIAIVLGDIAAFALASVIVKPLQKLVLHVKRIGETADKETLEGEEIEIRSRDEIRTLGDAVNDMTRGLVKAAKDEKVAARIREENVRTREAAAKAQAEAAEAQAKVLEEQEKALEAQKMNMDGKSVQNALIPLDAGRDNKQTTASYRDREIDLFCYYEGSDDVSGDFFDYKKLDERWYAVIKCDVSGHGIPAALLVAVIATIFREYFSDWSYKKNGTRINELAGKLNEFIGNLGLRGKFATLLIGLFDSKNDDVYLCHAGDRIVRFFDAERKQQKTVELDSAASGMPAAGQIEQWMVDMKGGYQVRRLKLKKGDILFLYTDGIEEAQSVFKDEHFHARKCGETKALDKDGRHINHMPEEEYEEFGNDRIKEIVESVFNRRKYTLRRCHPQDPSERLEFDLTKCEGSTEEMILALASVEKVFRMYRRPDARGTVTKDDKGNIRIDGDGIRVDRKIDDFLSRTFSGYGFYCRDRMDLGEQNYIYYVNVNEDKQADDLTIFAVKNL